jgi:DNA-directed RNA polymerase sigma subunit (sigma70/sigma32)
MKKEIEDILRAAEKRFDKYCDEAKLGIKERKVLQLRLGIVRSAGMKTLEEIGVQEFGVTRERVRQISDKAIEKIRISSSLSQEFTIRDLETLINQ